MTKKEDKEEPQDVHGVFNLADTPKEKKQDEQKDDKKLDMRAQFEVDRNNWKDTIISMANKFKDMKNMSELQIQLYSNRQIVLEQSHYLQSLLAKVVKSYKKSLGSKTIEYMNGDRKLKMGETSILVESAVAEYKEQIDLIESQIEYMNETKKNIDNMVFGLGHRIQLEDYRKTV